MRASPSKAFVNGTLTKENQKVDGKFLWELTTNKIAQPSFYKTVDTSLLWLDKADTLEITMSASKSSQGSRVQQELEVLRQKQLAKNQRDKLKDCE